MYSWKIIRIICTVLLLLPIVHLAFLMSRETLETLNNSPDAWVREVNSYAKTDTLSKLPERPIVIVGGRRVKLWENLDDLLAPKPVLMRGLGDAIVEDITFNYTQLVGFYRPDTVVLLPSDSEFHLRDNKSARGLAEAIRELVDLDTSHGVTRRFYVFTPIKTLLHPGDSSTIERATAWLQKWAESNERVVILDANPLFAGPDGLPRAIYFRGDGVNLNEHGYLRLSVLLSDQVQTDEMGPPEDASSS